MYCLAAELNSKSELTGSFKLSAYPLLKCLAALYADCISTAEMLGSFIMLSTFALLKCLAALLC